MSCRVSIHAYFLIKALEVLRLEIFSCTQTPRWILPGWKTAVNERCYEREERDFSDIQEIELLVSLVE